MDVHARLRLARIAPRKMRRVAKLLPGLAAAEAESQLSVLAPKSAGPLLKLLRSAIANAKHNFNLEQRDLVVKNVIVGSGMTLKRTMPRARGSAYRIEKKTSHVDLVLSERAPGATPRAGKASEVVTRRIEEVAAEELAGQGERQQREEASTSGAVKRLDRTKGLRRLFDRRGGER